MKFKDYLKQSKQLEEANVDIFDDVKNKTTKKLYKVVDIVIKGGNRFFKLRPLEGKATSEDEFNVDNKEFMKNYALA